MCFDWRPQVLVDCANGVGSAALQRLTASLQARGGAAAALKLKLVNTGEGGLNDNCGADYVQKERSQPVNFQAALDATEAIPRCSSPLPPPLEPFPFPDHDRNKWRTSADQFDGCHYCFGKPVACGLLLATCAWPGSKLCADRTRGILSGLSCHLAGVSAWMVMQTGWCTLQATAAACSCTMATGEHTAHHLPCM